MIDLVSPSRTDAPEFQPAATRVVPRTTTDFSSFKVVDGTGYEDWEGL